MDNPDTLATLTQDEDKQNKKHNIKNLNDEQHGPHQITGG